MSDQLSGFIGKGNWVVVGQYFTQMVERKVVRTDVVHF